MLLALATATALAARGASAFPLAYATNGSVVLTSAYGGDIALQPAVGGARAAWCALQRRRRALRGPTRSAARRTAAPRCSTVLLQPAALRAAAHASSFASPCPLAGKVVSYGRLSAPQGLQLNGTLLTEALLLSLQSGGGGGGGGGAYSNCIPPLGTALVQGGSSVCGCAAGWSGISCTTPAAGTVIYLVYNTCPTFACGGTVTAACPLRYSSPPTPISLKAYTYLDGVCTQLKLWSQIQTVLAATAPELNTIDPLETASITFDGTAWTATCAPGASGSPCTASTYSAIAGSLSSFGSADGTGSLATFGSRGNSGGDQPNGLATDGAGTYFLCDTSNAAVRKITSAGVVTTLSAGSSTPVSSQPLGNSGSNTACTPTSGLCMPLSCAYYGGFVYVQDVGQNAVYKVNAVTGATTVFAGMPGNYGYVNGAGASAQFRFSLGGDNNYVGNDGNRDTSSGIAIAPNGDIYLADMGNFAIRKISGSTVSTVTGDPSDTSYINGPATSARFNFPGGVAFDSTDPTNTALYIIDGLNQAPQVRMLLNGIVSTIAINGAPNFAPGTLNFEDRLTGIAVKNGTVYVSCFNFNTDWGTQIYKISPSPGYTPANDWVVGPLVSFAVAPLSQSVGPIRTANNGAFLPPFLWGSSYGSRNVSPLVASFLMEADGSMVLNMLYTYVSSTTALTTFSSQILRITPPPV